MHVHSALCREHTVNFWLIYRKNQHWNWCKRKARSRVHTQLYQYSFTYIIPIWDDHNKYLGLVVVFKSKECIMIKNMMMFNNFTHSWLDSTPLKDPVMLWNRNKTDPRLQWSGWRIGIKPGYQTPNFLLTRLRTTMFLQRY